MKEIGGYIELENFTGEMMYNDAVKLNSARNALEYIIKTRTIRKIWYPYFMCSSNDEILRKYGIEVSYYSIDEEMKPILHDRPKDEWLYLVNYYGQLTNEYIKTFGNRVIVDNCQAYFQEAIKDVDTIYSCRKFFGVPDGAILYTDCRLNDLEKDYSFDRMRHLLGRYERSASDFYNDYQKHEEDFWDITLRKMSKLTENLLRGINYEHVIKRRTENYQVLYDAFRKINKLNVAEIDGAFMYPLYIDNGAEVRKKLQNIKIYVPTLWNDVIKKDNSSVLEKHMANDILPLPIDQRYDLADMEYVVKCVCSIL